MRPLRSETLTAILQHKPESYAARMVRELAAEAGGGAWLLLLLAASAFIGFAIGGTFK